MEASGSPPKYCFVLFHSLNLYQLSSNKLYPWTQKISNPEDQTERKNDKPETPRSVVKKSRDSKTQQSPKTLSRFRRRAKVFRDPRLPR